MRWGYRLINHERGCVLFFKIVLEPVPVLYVEALINLRLFKHVSVGAEGGYIAVLYGSSICDGQYEIVNRRGMAVMSLSYYRTRQ